MRIYGRRISLLLSGPKVTMNHSRKLHFLSVRINWISSLYTLDRLWDFGISSVSLGRSAADTDAPGVRTSVVYCNLLELTKHALRC